MKIEEFLGENIIEKYKDILPILYHILYRTQVWGRDGVNPFDGFLENDDYYKNNLRLNLTYHLRMFYKKYLILDKKNRKHSSVLMSESLFRIGKYDELIKKLADSKQVVRFCSVYNVDEWRKEVTHKFIPLKVERSITGGKLKTIIFQIYDKVTELINHGENCVNNQSIIQLFDKLQYEASVRIHQLSKLLKEYRVKKFITLNQNNIADILILLACKKLNIATVLYLHHEVLYNRTKIKNND